MPRRQVDEASKLDDGEPVSGGVEAGLSVGHGGEHLTGAVSGGAGDEGAEEGGGEALVGVAVGRGDVVENPEDLLSQSGVVAFNSISTVNKKLFCAISISEGSKRLWCGEAWPWTSSANLVLVHCEV